MMQPSDLPAPSFQSIALVLGEKDIIILRLQALVEQLRAQCAALQAQVDQARPNE